MSSPDPSLNNPGVRSDPLDRGSAGDDPDTEPDEYELEDIDPDARAVQRHYAAKQMSEAAESLNVDEFYAEYDRGLELDNVLQDFNFRFQIRHLMLLTAGLAVVLSLWKIANFAGLLLLTLILLGGAHLYVAYRERKRQEEIQASRDRLVQLVRAQKAGDATAACEVEETAVGIREENTRAPMRLSFSMKQVMIAVTAACLVLGLMVSLPLAGVVSVQVIAGVLGILAVLGIGVHIAGYDPPPAVALGWWLIMAMYVVLSVVGQFRGAGGV